MTIGLNPLGETVRAPSLFARPVYSPNQSTSAKSTVPPLLERRGVIKHVPLGGTYGRLRTTRSRNPNRIGSHSLK